MLLGRLGIFISQGSKWAIEWVDILGTTKSGTSVNEEILPVLKPYGTPGGLWSC